LLNESSTTPIVVGNTIFASSVTAGSIGLKWDADADEMKIEQVWKNPKLTCYFGTPIPFGKQDVLMVTGALLPPVSATLRCVDATTGKEKWNHPKVGKYHATLMGVADGQALMLEEGGELVLIGNRADRYTELARSKICGETWAHPALVDGILYLRDNKEVMALRLNR